MELTFDDGPAATTASVLDTLKAKNVKATFFLLGANVVNYPDLVVREVAEGHTVGNHTWSHPDLTALTGQTVVPTNQWGVEVIVSSAGVITAISDRYTTSAAAPTIPTGGWVLSGHGAARTWLLARSAVGGSVGIPSPLATGKSVTVGGATRVVDGVNTGRSSDQLIVYTRLTSTDRAVAELQNTSDLIAQVSGVRPTVWRPPMSRYNSSIVSAAQSLGLTMKLFDVDSYDWDNYTPAAIRAKVLAEVESGSVIDLHDIGSNTAAALPQLIDDLRANGFCP